MTKLKLVSGACFAILQVAGGAKANQFSYQFVGDRALAGETASWTSDGSINGIDLPNGGLMVTDDGLAYIQIAAVRRFPVSSYPPIGRAKYFQEPDNI
jgi:hypothetical protein